MKIGKYEFNDYEQAQKKIDDLGYEIEVIEGEEIKHINHGHCVVELGNIIISHPEYDEDGNIIKETEYSNKYHVDVLWDGIEDHPYGWKSYAVVPEGNGLHTFFGLEYEYYKI